MARGKRNGIAASGGLSRITVSGFKSIREERSIEVRPLTLLAGANSSGKSSMIQPLLLLKQTLDATYDPGPLRLDGPNVRFTKAEQLIPQFGRGESASRELQVEIEHDYGRSIRTIFEPAKDGGFSLKKWLLGRRGQPRSAEFALNASSSEIENSLSKLEGGAYLFEDVKKGKRSVHWSVDRDRCYFRVLGTDGKSPGTRYRRFDYDLSASFTRMIQRVVHVPGLRGNPSRTYPVTAVGKTFEGTFENYVASVIRQWELSDSSDDQEKLDALRENVEALGLTWKVRARQLSDIQVELLVGRFPHARQGGANDLVNVADVGVGVSQTLPVLVALIEAEPGQAVVLEQPEIHLHPRAQVAMAGVLARAARRGVRVIMETHSALLLTAIQAVVAEGEELSPDEVILHWFERDKIGQTDIRSTPLDDAGAFGNWPVDFGDVLLDVQGRYLDAAERRLLGVANG